ncbi:hypothetical protein [Acidocella sp.]|uniref:hypothetical protein n=1 Tax=Acidocella sp. TaxID=50710 RepID=UPI003D05C813
MPGAPIQIEAVPPLPYIDVMANNNGPVLDMTPDGQFVEPPKPSLTQVLLRLAAFGLALCVGAALVWTAFLMIPVLLVLGFAGYLFARGQRRGWRPF